MKRNLILALILTGFLMLGGATLIFTHTENDNQTVAQEADSPSAAYYTCPMHPSVHSDWPGACPVCGMALVRKSAAAVMSRAELASLQAVSLSPTQRVLANITTATVRQRSLRREITAVGMVGFAEPMQVTVAARFRGRIEKLHVSYTGEKVRKGQPLFDLYSPDLITAEQEYRLAFEGVKTASKSSYITTGDMQRQLLHAARERLKVHFGLTDGQIESLDRSTGINSTRTFYSPISGTVIKKDIQEGQYVDDGMVLYELADLSRVWVYLDVYEKDIQFIAPGQTIQVTTNAYPHEMFAGHVTFIDPVLNAETRTVRVRTEFPNPDEKLKPNMYVNARVGIPLDDALVIPASSVLSTGKRSVVWVEVMESVFEPREVIIGTTTEAFAQVIAGLNEGDKVAETGGYLIDSEAALQQPTSSGDSDSYKTAKRAEAEGEPFAHPERNLKNKTTRVSQNEQNVLVKGRYIPDVIFVKVGKPVRLNFYRDEDADCTNEVVFEGLDIRQRLPARETTTIEFMPTEKGEIAFTCGMGMIRGKVVVE